MILADVYDLLNSIFFQIAEFVAIAALIVLAVFIGSRLRKLYDRKKGGKKQKKDEAIRQTTLE